MWLVQAVRRGRTMRGDTPGVTHRCWRKSGVKWLGHEQPPYIAKSAATTARHGSLIAHRTRQRAISRCEALPRRARG
jgi:hypothetical protein